MKEKVSSAAGEAMLVRIELERFQKSMAEAMDKAPCGSPSSRRMVQEQHMDVEAAVQLERLEEIERAVIALDPSQFVRKDEGAPRDGLTRRRASRLRTAATRWPTSAADGRHRRGEGRRRRRRSHPRPANPTDSSPLARRPAGL